MIENHIQQSARSPGISASASHHFIVFSQDQVVLAHRDDEDDRRDALEAVDPLLALRPLPSYVEHPDKKSKSTVINMYM